MRSKTAIIILSIIVIISGLFFVYLYFSGKLFLIMPNTETNEKIQKEPTEADLILEEMKKTQKIDDSNLTPPERSKIIQDLMKQTQEEK